MLKSYGGIQVKPLGLAAWRLVVMFTILCFGISSSTGAGATPWTTDYEIKAAFINSIVPYVEWPSGALGDRLLIGFAGEGPMAAVMVKFFSGKHVGTRPVEIREVHSRTEMRACNVLVLEYPDRSRTREALAQLKGTNVLTIGNGEQFTRSGGIITFVPHENTFRLTINPQSAERARLKISSKLMGIAKLVAADESAAKD